MWNLKCSVFALLLCSLAYVSYAANENPVVQTPLGRIKGSLMYTWLNKTIYAFRGVRYGKTTAGENRFKQAIPVDPWTDIADASQEGPSCPLLTVPHLASEDCLRVNVYTTKLPDSSDKVNRPVIVFFHPGAFFGFSGQSYVFGPQYFLEKDIVLVTVNYRLGSLGFTATGDARAPGNLGLKDQVEALRWVKQNIASFGGNPNSVTISGYSAGSWSVILHLLSPMSKGLFHRAIAMSGAPTMLVPLPMEHKNVVIKHASFVGCPTDTLDSAINCLKTVPHQKLSDAQPQLFEWYKDPTLIWSPVVEPEISGVERFLHAQPADLIREKKFAHVPIITGITKDEFAGLVLNPLEEALNGNDSVFRNLTKNWEYEAPILFKYERYTPRSKNISRELRKFFFHDQPITSNNAENLGLIYADSIIGFPTQHCAELLAENSRAPVYNYLFTYQGRYSFSVWNNTKKPYGVVHHDDLQYVYYMSFIFPLTKPTDPEAAIVERMTTIWANFAKTDEPIPKNNKLFGNLKWTKMSPQTKNYLEIGTEMKMKQNMFAERYALWDRLFPL